MTDRPPPEGFVEFAKDSGFIGFNGPVYARKADGHIDIGFYVIDRLCNPGGTCHGGWLSSFADIQLAAVSYFHADKDRDPQERSFFATISLSVDFLAAVKLGAWVEGRGEVLRVTRNTAFAQMVATADGKPCLRASGVFRI